MNAVGRVKICGIRSKEDLEISIEAGADVVGMVCGVTRYRDDSITRDKMRELTALTPVSVPTALVTHLETADEILGLADYVHAAIIQVHAPIRKAELRKVYENSRDRMIIQTVRVNGPEMFYEAADAMQFCDAILLGLDPASILRRGQIPSGWKSSRLIVREVHRAGKLAIIAGGVNPDNIADAIRFIMPDMVDVNSGVETPQGHKSLELCELFAERAREAFAAT
jgi:phosphoribosylanthranilate isomerase